MNVKKRYVIQREDGLFLTVRSEPTTDLFAAVRFSHPEDANRFLYGMYGPKNPESYRIRRIKITAEMEDEEGANSEG